MTTVNCLLDIDLNVFYREECTKRVIRKGNLLTSFIDNLYDSLPELFSLRNNIESMSNEPEFFSPRNNIERSMSIEEMYRQIRHGLLHDFSVTTYTGMYLSIKLNMQRDVNDYKIYTTILCLTKHQICNVFHTSN